MTIRLLLTLAALLAPGIALACDPMERYAPDTPIKVGPTCGFVEAGSTDGFEEIIEGSAVTLIGNGRLVQRITSTNACDRIEELLVVDCTARQAILIQGMRTNSTDESSMQTSADALIARGGPIRLGQQTEIADLARQAARGGLDHTTDVAARVQGLKPINRYDPFCGCALPQGG